MKSKKELVISMLLLVFTLIIFIINKSFYNFADWIIRLNGILMLLCIPVVTYYTFSKPVLNK